MENSNQEHVFIEDIIYCPSQIYYYFTEPDEENESVKTRFWVAYIRQRGGPLSFELVEIERETGDWLWDYENGNSIKLSRTYDINNQPNEEEEEKAPKRRKSSRRKSVEDDESDNDNVSFEDIDGIDVIDE
jgi:hypothetical protein